MTGSVRLPLLFLDVDGPLIPFGAEPQHYPTYATGSGLCEADANPLLTRIDPQHGAKLAALPCEVVWATTWMHEANECIAPVLGLPQLAVAVWPEPSDVDEQDERDGLHWKTRALVEWAAGRTFVWVDDEVTDTDRAWVAAHHRGRARLHRVDARLGLADGDYEALDSWLRQPCGPEEDHQKCLVATRHPEGGGPPSENLE
ncbi:HAD domain-containing protein [Streptomyces sp. NPDC090442]|uniref:HAD domain-containing protein n=1 Tax=Streptomyces sp. NPDC090442 TaxID=3365962 RepID=UPI00380E3EB9